MSTIIDKLNRLTQYKQDIKSSIINKGQSVDDDMSKFADAISKISGGVELPEIHDTDPLTFVRVDNATVDCSISIVNNRVTNNKQFQYNKNDNGWTDYIVGDIIPMDYGDKVQFRSNDTTSVCTNLNAYRKFKTIGLYNCGGTLASLMNNNTTISLPSYCFTHLFYYCNIVNAPILPWEHINSNCYDNMFTGCTSLVNAPELPATTLASSCYANMFENCTSLVNAPELPATTLASSCYANMFENCTSLVNAPELPATTLAYSCYSNMFTGCTSLVNAPELPATTLANSCYQFMFQNCTSLVNAHELPATTLASNCYQFMFQNCTSLVNAPELPATTLANSCYYYMFSGCTKLNTIKAKCMYSSGTTLITSSIASGWLTSVSSTGTFYKNPDWSGPTSRGTNTIPSGWTIVDWDTEQIDYFWVEPDASMLTEGNNYIGFYRCTDTTDEQMPQNAIQYSFDGKNWEFMPYVSGETYNKIELIQKTYFRYVYNSYIRHRISGIHVTSSSTTEILKCNVGGSLHKYMNDVYYNDNLFEGSNYDFNSFFKGLAIIDASKLKVDYFKDNSARYEGYSYMFKNQSFMKYPPALKFNTLGESACSGMFYGCSSLLSAPELHATTLADYCYDYMFYGCTSLVNAPELHATTLKSGCYDNMFEGCSSLSNITCYAENTTIGLHNWVKGVKNTGTFNKRRGVEWPTGISGIPENWTVNEI